MKVALIGYGAINRQVATVLAEKVPGVEVAAVGLDREDVSLPDLPNVRVFSKPVELESIKPDIVVEAASRGAVKMWGEAALASAKAFVISSASALADDDLCDHLDQYAKKHGSRLIVSSGAVGAVDALAAVAYVGVDRLHHKIVKPTSAWRGTPADSLMGLKAKPKEVSFFSGTARAAGDLFPANANVAVVTAKSSGVGLDDALVELVADANASENRHIITATGGFGKISAEVHNRPLASNSKSSQLAAMALVRIIVAQTPGVRFQLGFAGDGKNEPEPEDRVTGLMHKGEKIGQR